MVVALASLTVGNDATDGTVYTTASVTPGAYRLCLLAVASRHDGVDATPTVTGNGLTWVEVATVADAAFGVIRNTVFRAMGASPSTGVITITFGTTQRRCGWSLVEGTRCATGGTNGSGAIVQAVTDGTSSTGGGVVDVTLAAFGSSGNATYGAVTLGSAGGINQGAGFTELHGQDIEAIIAQDTQWRADPDTVVDWATGASIAAAAIAIEIRAAYTNVQRVTASNTGTVTTATITIAAATAVNLIVAILAVDKNSGTITVPTGFTRIGTDYVQTDVSFCLAYKIAAGGETDIVWVWATGHQCSMWAAEYTLLAVVDQNVRATSGGTSVTTLSSGTTSATTSIDELAIAFMASDTCVNTETGRSWTQSFTEVNYDVVSGSGRPGLSIAEKELTPTGTVESTFATTDSGDQMIAGVVTFKEAGAAAVPPPRSLNINQSVSRAASW